MLFAAGSVHEAPAIAVIVAKLPSERLLSEKTAVKSEGSRNGTGGLSGRIPFAPPCFD